MTTSQFRPPRALLWLTCAILFAVSATVHFTRTQLPPAIHLNTTGQPTLGYAKARVHLVVFEEPQCSHCRDFNNEIFPTLKKDYIDTHKIRYTVVPVAFLPGSMSAAIATLCVYYENPLYPNDDLFFKYVDYIYNHQPKKEGNWVTPAKLLQFAKATSPAIDLEQLSAGIAKEEYRVQVERNTAYGAQIMGGEIFTPTVYVNGIRVDDISLDNIRKLIIRVLEHEGVH